MRGGEAALAQQQGLGLGSGQKLQEPGDVRGQGGLADQGQGDGQRIVCLPGLLPGDWARAVKSQGNKGGPGHGRQGKIAYGSGVFGGQGHGLGGGIGHGLAATALGCKAGDGGV